MKNFDLIKNYLSNNNIRISPSIINNFIIHHYDESYLFFEKKYLTKFVKTFKYIVGDFEGSEETAKWMLNLYVKYKNDKNDSIFATVAANYEDNYDDYVDKPINKNYVNVILKNNDNAISNYLDNLIHPSSNPIEYFKNNIEEFILFDLGENWENYFFYCVPKNASKNDKELLLLLFDKMIHYYF